MDAMTLVGRRDCAFSRMASRLRLWPDARLWLYQGLAAVGQHATVSLNSTLSVLCFRGAYYMHAILPVYCTLRLGGAGVTLGGALLHLRRWPSTQPGPDVWLLHW